MAKDRGKQSPKLNENVMDDLARMSCERAHRTLDRTLQLVPHLSQQYALVMTVISYLLNVLIAMHKEPRNQAIERVITNLRAALDEMGDFTR